MSAPTVGLRERKKVATRQALHEAAVRLTVEHGLDRLTVEAIADAADVSRRTFSNYFANKEEALLWSDRARIARLLEFVAARPAREPPWDAMSAAAIELAAGSSDDPRWEAQVRLLRGAQPVRQSRGTPGCPRRPAPMPPRRSGRSGGRRRSRSSA